MAENTNTEREAFESALKSLASQNGVRLEPCDFSREPSGEYEIAATEIAWAIWQARASLSLPAAGQEPVAWRLRGGDWHIGKPSVEFIAWAAENHPEAPIEYAAPQPAVAAGWVNVKDRLPEPCKPVLLDIGRKYPIRAMWAPKLTLPTDGDVDYGEYDEATDDYYCHEGWYEWNQNEETHWAVSETPRAWCELPQPLPPAPSTEGEDRGGCCLRPKAYREAQTLA